MVDDDYYFRSILKTSLESQGYAVTDTEDGSLAIQRLSLEDYDLVVSDIQMVKTSGLELLRWVNANKRVPVILMTGFMELLETHEASQLGVSGILSKPFKREDLLTLIQTVIETKENKKKETIDLDNEYCKISIDDFVTGSSINFDIYIRISNTKYLKIANSGQDISVDRIKTYKQKNLNYLYLSKPDFKRYVGFNSTLAKAVGETDKIDHKKKVNFLKHTSEVLLEQMHQGQLDAEDYAYTKNIVEVTTSVIVDNKTTFNLLEMLNSQHNALYAHSVGVSFYSALIGKKLGWKSASNLFKLSMSGLFHDVGKKEIPTAILKKSRLELTPEDVQLLETHSLRGMEILSQIPDMQSDVLQIVVQHHENILGTGYPSHVKASRIHPMAKVVAVADEFCKLTIRSITGENPISPDKALEKLMVFHSDTLDATALLALMDLFKFKPNHEIYQALCKKRKPL